MGGNLLEKLATWLVMKFLFNIYCVANIIDNVRSQVSNSSFYTFPLACFSFFGTVIKQF